jgi:hypothetical protein
MGTSYMLVLSPLTVIGLSTVFTVTCAFACTSFSQVNASETIKYTEYVYMCIINIQRNSIYMYIKSLVSKRDIDHSQNNQLIFC